MTCRSLIALSIVLAAGCGDTYLSAVTVPPPGKVAHLDDDDDNIDLSRGIALGFECTSSDNDYYGPCRDATAKVGDDTVAAVYASLLDTLADGYHPMGSAGQQARSAFVIVGLRAGKTTLSVDSSDGGVTFDVTVLDP